MECTVEGCEETPTLHFTWAWGEEGACCDAHRSYLESKASQLGRTIAFERGSTLRDYKPPVVRDLSPELGALRMQNAELMERVKKDQETIGLLEAKIYELQSKLADQPAAPPTAESSPASPPSGAAPRARGSR